MNIQIDRQNDVPRITENGKIVYSEKSDTLYIRTLKEGTKAIGGNSSIIETDPVFQTWLSTPPNVSTFTNDSGYLTSFSETDPIFSLWQSTYDNHADWDTAYGWGNHASVGYLTGITSGDVTTALGYTPVTNARTLTINGTTYDLTADRSWTISGSGVSALSAIGSTPNANSATITGSTLNLEPASVSFGGVVTTVAQTFAGRKTFNDYITIAAGTASANTAPLKLTSGTRLTVVESGTVEFTTNNFYLSPSSTVRLTAGLGTNGTLYSTAFGLDVLNGNTTGAENTGFGYYALRANTTGVGNTSLGVGCLVSNTQGSRNVAVGYGALNVFNSTSNVITSNTAIGNAAMFSTTTGVFNTAVGGYVAQQAQSSYGTYYGIQAGYTVHGNYNLAIGHFAMGSTTINAGTYNIAIGTNALLTQTAGANNIGIGTSTMVNLTGAGNVAIGFSALNAVIGGGYNISLGFQSGNAITTGSKNVTIGYDVDAQSNTADGQLSIQNAIFGTGNTGTGTTASTGNIGIYIPAPSARLHLPAGTATANTAPLKLTSGTNLTTPEDGAFEFDGTNLYFTVGGVRKTVTLV